MAYNVYIVLWAQTIWCVCMRERIGFSCSPVTEYISIIIEILIPQVPLSHEQIIKIANKLK